MTGDTLEAWVAALADELELDMGGLDIQAVLDVARDAAHSVTRPAAPLTTLLVGYAAGRAGASAEQIAAACRRAGVFASEWHLA
jgi:pyrrolidone-carboxylate peptidase